MSEIKTLQVVTKEALDKDQPIVNIIIDNINDLIDGVMLLEEEEYTFDYEIENDLTTTVPIQKQRIMNFIKKTLTDNGYRVTIDEDNLWTIKWAIAGLTKLPNI